MEEITYKFRSHIFSFLCEHFRTVPKWNKPEPENDINHGTIFSNCGRHHFSAIAIRNSDTGELTGGYAVIYVTPMQELEVI